MPESALNMLVRRLARVATAPGIADEPDPELLRRFAVDRDEIAFAALVARHGSMVFDVCRAVFGNHADTEDAFQATFLVLARNAGTIRRPGSLAAWLHGVAYRIASKVRARAARRREHEARAPAREHADPDDLSWTEVRLAVHEALATIGERYRAPLVLCYLGGMTQDHAATALGLTHAAVKKRLERGRQMLRAALVRRGLGPTAIITAFAIPATSISPALAASAIGSAILAATGRTADLPANILSLAHGGHSMLSGKLAATLLLLPALAVGFVLASSPTLPGTQAGAPVPANRNPDPPTDREMEWLAGEWEVVDLKASGKSAFTNDDRRNARITFKNGTARVKNLGLLFFKNFTFKLDPAKTPKEIDITFSEGPINGTTFAGIYVTRRNELRICLRLERTELGRPKGFSTVSGAGLYTFILRPVDEKAPPPFPAKPVAPKPAAPNAILKPVFAQLVIPGGVPAQRPVVLAPVVQIQNSTLSEVDLTFDPNDVEITLRDAAGKAVPPSKASPGGPRSARGLIPPRGYIGFLTHDGGLDMSEAFSALVIGDRMWVLNTGKYTVTGSVPVMIILPAPRLEERGGVKELPARFPATRVKLELKPMTFEIPTK